MKPSYSLDTERLAFDMAEFYKDYDTYGFYDVYDSTDAAVIALRPHLADADLVRDYLRYYDDCIAQLEEDGETDSSLYYDAVRIRNALKQLERVFPATSMDRKRSFTPLLRRFMNRRRLDG